MSHNLKERKTFETLRMRWKYAVNINIEASLREQNFNTFDVERYSRKIMCETWRVLETTSIKKNL